jgi:hypothetical protein
MVLDDIQTQLIGATLVHQQVAAACGVALLVREVISNQFDSLPKQTHT